MLIFLLNARLIWTFLVAHKRLNDVGLMHRDITISNVLIKQPQPISDILNALKQDGEWLKLGLLNTVNRSTSLFYC